MNSRSRSALLNRRDLLAAAAASASLVALPRSSLAQSGDRAPDAPRTGAASVAAHRVEVPMPHGGISAGHPLAAMAGTRMLLQGGSAADAVIAAMAVLNVVEPWASSAAGNGFATCFERKSGKVSALAFTGGAPALLDPAVDPAELARGPKAVATPGAFGGWIALARRYGRLPLATLLEPAIGYARDGHPLDSSIAATIARARATLARYPTSAAIFLPGGQPPAPRSIFRNVPLARTFQALADAEARALKGGADRDRALLAAHDHFYTGPVAQAFDRFMRETGGWLRLDDMRAFGPRWADPVSTTYRGLDVYCSPLTSRTGLELCEQLNIVEGWTLDGMGGGDAAIAHLLIEAIKIAKADVYRYAADPASAAVPVDRLLSKTFAAARRRLISPARAMTFPQGADLAGWNAESQTLASRSERSTPGDTTSLTAIDSDGNAICVTTTIGGGFGTFVVMGDTGLLCNNGLRHGSTSPYAGHPNHVAPGRIALLGNGPTIVLDKGRLHLAFGSPGGETIGQTQFQFLVNVVDRGMSIQQAIESPRFALDAEPNFYRPGARIRVQMESRFDEATRQALSAMGHAVEAVGPYAIGSVQGVLVDASGAVMGGADPRRMGYALGY
ncbi:MULTISPECIES: gamma-glutamyltransferase family protein [unclassified Sphingobium]|uniref:gamma-glutamyltransferase family protein n=1 Tax=unclassified Sphingobium TaxID=2611147 RepID=UPI0022240CD5|nr:MULTISPECIES: gamma-glutamyltransferase [unclassified Sphingobium]MCW2413329.1 gamma-glutamyltranspeptidase/glutathione hydrolase [Sphingobium sp. B8D3D]MCW2414372.1 gamma-glutamyltranspeptidase/glutathione hydrolase [Sphingobium sp. B8D3A]